MDLRNLSVMRKKLARMDLFGGIYNFRRVRGGGALSRHSWGIAIDLDPDANGNLDPQGRLATDRPHVLKLYGATVLPFGTEIGVNFYAGSGTPLTTYVNTLNGIEVMVNGRGDMGRTPVLSTTDLLVSHQI